VKFHENEFPFDVHQDKTHVIPPISYDIVNVDDDIGWETYDAPEGGKGVSVSLQRGGSLQGGLCSSGCERAVMEADITTDEGENVANVDAGVNDEATSTHTTDGHDVVAVQDDNVEVGEPEMAEENNVVEEMMGKGMRNKFPSSSQQHASGTPYLITYFGSCERFSLRHRNFVAAVTAGKEPKIFKEDVKDSGWRDAMAKEIQALEENATWVLTTLPPGKKALGSKWVYRIKHHSDGSIKRLKARLVIFGHHQIEGIDYDETFAPVAKMVTVRTFLAVAAIKKWEVHQMDVHNTFHHGDLDEEVYMKIPPGFKNTNQNLVCKLKKLLYGLKQAPRCWFAKLSIALKRYGFVQSYSDYSLFTLHRGEIQISVLVYVDDLIIVGNDIAAMKFFKAYLGECSNMKVLGVLKYFLGLELARNPDGIYLCHRKYALEIIDETGMLGAKPADFHMDQHHKLALVVGTLLEDPEPYRRLVGRLIYLWVTRPDLAYSVHILSQFIQEPRIEH